MAVWEFQRAGETVRVDPIGPLAVRAGAANHVAVQAAVAGSGIVYLF